MPASFPPALPPDGSPGASGSHAERRNRSRRMPWRVVPTGVGPGHGFLAFHEPSGRSYRLPVDDRDEAERYVAALNRSALEIRA